MQLSEIGTTGIKIPPIIFGTSALGNLYTALADDTKFEIVKQAIENVPSPVVFDSAGKYGAGLALEKLGECLDKLNVAPEDVIISNKLGWKRTPLLTAELEYMKRGSCPVDELISGIFDAEGAQKALECWAADPAKVFRLLIRFEE